MVVTFDFDDTLLYRTIEFDEDGDVILPHQIVGDGRNPLGFHHLLDHLDAGDEVHIVTSRMRGRLPEVEDWLRRWGVRGRIAGVHATDGAWKGPRVAELGASIHYDDDQEELDHLTPPTEGQLIPPHPSWLVNGTR